jgi:hypothetical protein
MIITIYNKGKVLKSFQADEIDIRVSDDLKDEDDGAVFFVKSAIDGDGITIDAEITMTAEFGENQITLIQ